MNKRRGSDEENGGNEMQIFRKKVKPQGRQAGRQVSRQVCRQTERQTNNKQEMHE